MKVPTSRNVDVMKDFFPPELWRHAEYCYSQGHRGYHTFAHAQDVMQRVLYLDSVIGFMNIKAAMLAALYHDAVYVPGAIILSNEDNSCAQLDAAMVYVKKDKSFDRWILPPVKSLIKATARHLAPRHEFSDWDTCLFMDCDMMGFADEEVRFDLQNTSIDYEFGQDPANLTKPYLAGRVYFLENLKERGVFLSPPVRRYFEERALANIDRELHRVRVALAKFPTDIFE